MTLITPLSLIEAASNAGITQLPISMSNFDTRTPVNIKYCDIMNSARIRYSANHFLMKNPTLVDQQSLSNLTYAQTGTLVTSLEAFNRTPGGAYVSPSPKINISYTAESAPSNVSIEMTASNSGFALWLSDSYVYGASNEGVTVTVAVKTPTTLPSHVIDLKGWISTGGATGDALLLRTNVMFMKNYFNNVPFGWSNTGFTIPTASGRTVLSVRCPPNSIETYQDGVLCISYSNTYSFAYSPYAHLMGVDEVSGATTYAGTAFYEFMVHDFALTPTQIQQLHANIKSYYKW